MIEHQLVEFNDDGSTIISNDLYAESEDEGINWTGIRFTCPSCSKSGPITMHAKIPSYVHIHGISHENVLIGGKRWRGIYPMEIDAFSCSHCGYELSSENHVLNTEQELYDWLRSKQMIQLHRKASLDALSDRFGSRVSLY